MHAMFALVFFVKDVRVEVGLPEVLLAPTLIYTLTHSHKCMAAVITQLCV